MAVTAKSLGRRAPALTAAFLLCSLLPPLCSASSGRSPRMRGGAIVQKDLEALVESELSLRNDSTTASRLEAIERSMWPTFQALPKNAMGRISPLSVRLLVQKYFAKEHGWTISGLEPEGNKDSFFEVHEAKVLKDRAPALVEGLLEARQNGRGLSMNDAVVMIAVLERLIVDESLNLLKVAYWLHDLSTADSLTEDRLRDVLTSYMFLFEHGDKMHMDNPSEHKAAFARLKRKHNAPWVRITDFQSDLLPNFNFEHHAEINPFAPPKYSFDAASQIVTQLVHDYGRDTNKECRIMKEHLNTLDSKGNGRIALSKFHGQQASTYYRFAETTDYLRAVGALDESGNGEPRVLIANYLYGPSNCIAQSSYNSVCCLNECEVLMSNVESKIGAPSASQQRVLSAVKDAAFLYDERDIPSDMISKLQFIAEQNEDEVLLRGRLFAQWMHHVFPAECPYPHILENGAALSPQHWKGKKDTMTTEEQTEKRKQLASAAAPLEDDLLNGTDTLLWDDEEVWILDEVPKNRARGWWSALRIVMYLSLLAAVLSMVCRRAAWLNAFGLGPCQEKALLPVHTF